LVNLKLHRKKLIVMFAVVYVAVGLMAAMVASGAVVVSQTVRTSGILATANLGVYSDSACTQSLSSIDWGLVSPGGSVSKNVYVKNLGSTQVTLILSTTNWSPTTANGPVTVSWNRQNLVLGAGQVTSATLVLSVLSTANGFTGFSVDATITGTG
jgi:hypothetical protein